VTAVAAPSAHVPVSGRRARTRRVVAAAAIAVPVVILAIAAWQYRWMSDDGFINLRIVHNITAGHGPVFNTGERVEASTSPLWVAVLTVADVVLPLRLEWIAVLTGIALTLYGLAMLGLGALVLHRDRTTPWVVPAGAVVLIAIAPMWKFSSSGLENGLTVAWIGSVLYVLARWARGDRRLSAGGAVLVGLGPLVRPELSLLTVGALGVVVVADHRLGWRNGLGRVAIAFAVPVAYEIFRMGYYAALVPNSALAKEASRPYWSAGRRYLAQAIDPYWLWVPLVVLTAAAYAPLVLRAGSRVRAVALLYPIVGLLDALYIVRVGGDFMQARLLLPALVLLCGPVAVIPLRRATAAALLVVPWAVVAMAGLRSGADGPRAFGPDTTNAVTVDDFGWQPGGPARAWFDGHGVWFLEHRLPGTPSDHDPVVAEYGVGVGSYALGPDVYVLDLLGLGDAFTSHLRLDHRGTVAHEKPLPFPWVVARTLAPGSTAGASDFVLPKLFFARLLDRPGQQSFAARVADARVALHCGPLRAFLDHTTAPMSVGQFFDNLTSARANNAFRIPPEPRDARAKFCR
jgi:arabinofuranosyltransferase